MSGIRQTAPLHSRSRCVDPGYGVFAQIEKPSYAAGGVVDADGSVAAHVTIDPVDTTASAGETGGPDVPGDVHLAAGEPAAGPVTEETAGPTVKPASATTRTTATTVTKVTATNTTVSKSSKPNATTATTATLPKAGDSHCIALSSVFFLLGTALIATAHRC